MSWFTTFCRDLGLMVHNIRHPDRDTTVIRKETKTEERDGIVLRRTTIDEIEIPTEARKQRS